jgi:hypothetical protein
VGRITVAIGEDSGNVDMVERNGLSTTKDVAVKSGNVGRGAAIAELVKSVDTNGVTEVVEGLRAEVVLSTTWVNSGRLANLAPAVSVLTTVTRIRVAILVVVETAVVSGEASSLVAASTGVSRSRATLAEDLRELVNINVLLLGLEEILGPSRAIEVANRGGVAGLRVQLGNLTTVGPVSIGVNAEGSVARKSAVTSDEVASRLGEGEVTIGGNKGLGLSSGEVVNAVNAAAAVVADGSLTTVDGLTVAILETREARELASTELVKIAILTTTTVDRLSNGNTLETAEVKAVEDGRSGEISNAELETSVSTGNLTAVGGPLKSPVPTNQAVTIHASANLDFATVARITVAVFVTILALIVASTRLVATTDAVEDKVVDSLSEIIQSVTTLNVEVSIDHEELMKTIVIESPAT